MAAPRMVLSKRRLANQQPSSVRKRRHTRVPLDQAFLSEDHPFRGPPGCPNRPNPLASVSQRPTKKQLRPANPNGRDPFQHLNDDEIHQVVSYLDPKDTESMRRVSKFWKITSEYYCTKSVLKQCLPWTATQDLESLPSAFMNLYYRRHLYLYESIKLGYATRAYKISGVRDWHLNGSSLLYSNGVDKASVRKLRQGAACGVSVDYDDIPIGMAGIKRGTLEIPYMLLTNTGEILAVFRAHHNEGAFTDSISLTIVRGGQKWHRPLSGSICKPAIGKEAVYFMQSEQSSDNDAKYGPAFKKLSLKDGTTMFASYPPQIIETGVFVRQDQEHQPEKPYGKVKEPTTGRKIDIANLDTSLQLCGNETLAVWCDAALRVHIFSTVTGQILSTYDRSEHTRLAVSVVHPMIWDVAFDSRYLGVNAVRLTSYNEAMEAFNCGFSTLFGASNIVDTRFIDADYPLGFDLLNSVHLVHEDTRDPFVTLGIMGVEKIINEAKQKAWLKASPDTHQITTEEAVKVTLPPKAGQKDRRLLEIEAPWKVDKNDFLGLVQGYLVYHNFVDEELIVLDFWPEW